MMMVDVCKSGGITVEWVQALPENMVADVEYPVEYKLSINTTIYPLERVSARKGKKAHDLPHTNLHSCYQTGMACTPFVTHTPGLSTHTPAIYGNLSKEDDCLVQTFKTRVKLPMQRYTIIAHSRFFMPGKGGLVKVDTAVGIKRTVSEPPTSNTAYLGAGIFGGVVLVSIVSMIAAAKSGRLDLDSIVQAVVRDEVVLVADILFGLGDILAYTISFVQEIAVAPIMKEVKPIGAIILATGWLAYLASCTFSVRQLYLIFLRRYFEKAYLEATLRKAQQDFQSSHNHSDWRLACKKMVVDYTRARAGLRGIYIGLVTLLFQDLPLALIGGYLLCLSMSVEVTVVVLVGLSCALIGIKVHGLTNFKSQKQLVVSTASNLLDHLDNAERSPEDGTPTTFRRTSTLISLGELQRAVGNGRSRSFDSRADIGSRSRSFDSRIDRREFEDEKRSPPPSPTAGQIGQSVDQDKPVPPSPKVGVDNDGPERGLVGSRQI